MNQMCLTTGLPNEAWANGSLLWYYHCNMLPYYHYSVMGTITAAVHQGIITAVC